LGNDDTGFGEPDCLDGDDCPGDLGCLDGDVGWVLPKISIVFTGLAHC